jgi:hypothetical protein
LAANYANDPCFAYTTMHLNAQSLERAGNDAGGPHFLKSELGISMQITPQRHKFLVEFLYRSQW